MLRKFMMRNPTAQEAVLEALRDLSKKIEAKNIPIIMDDQDAGYDMAVDEILAVIDDAINQVVSGNDVDYSGGI